MVHSEFTREKIEKRYNCDISVLYMEIYEIIRSFNHPITDYEIQIKFFKKKYPNDHSFIIRYASNNIRVKFPIYKYSIKPIASLSCKMMGKLYYFWKSKREMVKQLCEDPNSLTDGEIEILASNVRDEDLELFEKCLPHDHLVYYDLFFMSVLKNPIGIEKIKENLVDSEKFFLNSFKLAMNIDL